MDYLQLIQSFGLPTALLFGLAYWFNKKDNQHREDLERIMNENKEEALQREDNYAALTKENNVVMTELRIMIRTFIDKN